MVWVLPLCLCQCPNLNPRKDLLFYHPDGGHTKGGYHFILVGVVPFLEWCPWVSRPPGGATAALKLKRNNIVKHYRKELDALYASAPN